jgi:hypothetical protein
MGFIGCHLRRTAGAPTAPFILFKKYFLSGYIFITRFDLFSWDAIS